MILTMWSLLKKLMALMMSLLNTDRASYTSALQNDKILSKPITGSFSVGASAFPGSAGNVATTSISHAFGEEVLPIMIWSNDDSTYQEAGATIYSESVTAPPSITATCYTTSSSVVVVAQNWTGSNQTCYYKIILIAES